MYPVIGTDIFFLPGRQQVNVYLRVFATYQVFCAKKRTFARCGFCLQSELLIENEKLHAHRRLWVMMLSLFCLLYTSPSPRDQRGSRMPSSA